jgi:hypothetical protein
MNCLKFETLLTDYIEERLSPLSRRSCAEHMMACRSCHDLVLDVKTSLELCSQAGTVEPLCDLIPSILQRTSAGLMMSCSVFDELIMNYFEGFISASDYHVFENHFDVCRRCQRLLQGVQLAQELCQNAKTVDIPEGLHERIMKSTVASNWRSHGGQDGLLFKWPQSVASFIRGCGQSVLLRDLMAGALLCLATLGLLLVEVSDDKSLEGVYRQARARLEETMQEQSQALSEQEKWPAPFKQVRASVGGVFQMGALLLSRPSEKEPLNDAESTKGQDAPDHPANPPPESARPEVEKNDLRDSADQDK